MEHLWTDIKYHDIHFKLDDETIFGAHRVVLANSKVEWFVTMLNSEFRDKTEKTIEIHDIETDVFEIALKYAYGMTPFDKQFKIKFETLYPIFKAASRFVCHSLINELKLKWFVRDKQDKLQVLHYIDCILQFGGEFITQTYDFKLNIMDVKIYFLRKYDNNYSDNDITIQNLFENNEEDNSKFVDDETTIENNENIKYSIKEAWKLCSFEQNDILSYLNIPGVIENMDIEEAEIFLKQIKYVEMYNKDKQLFLSVLTKLAKKGFIPYIEIIHLIAYKNPYQINSFPMKVGHIVHSSSYDKSKTCGTFLYGLYGNEKSDTIILGDKNNFISYVFYEE